MSKTDQFWQYAKEAILSASYAKTDEERQGLLDLGANLDASGFNSASVFCRSRQPCRCHTGNCWNLIRWPMVMSMIEG